MTVAAGAPGLTGPRQAARARRSTRHGLRLVPRLDQLWALVPVVFVFCYAASVPISHSDLFYMMLNGRLMAEMGQFPVQGDPFTYAPADSLFFNQPWLAQLAFWAAERVGGYPLIIFVHALALTTAFAFLTWLVRREGVSAPLAAGLALLGLVLAGSNFSIRPQTFAPLVFVAVLVVVRRSAPDQKRAIALMALLSVVWANLHGSFVLGSVLVVVHLAGSLIEERTWSHPRVRHFFALTVASLAGTLLNPVGPLVWLYAWRATTDPTNRFNNWEWQPTTLADLTGRVALTTLPIVLIGLFGGRKWPRPTDLLLLGTFGWLGLSMQRAMIWWALVVPAVLARQLASRFPAGQRRPRQLVPLNAALLIATGVLATLSLPWLRLQSPLLAPELRRYLSADHPTGAVEYLARSGGEGRIFARMEWGGYLAWSLWPRMHVFLDARVEQHPPAVWQDYFAILAARPDWRELLTQYGADYLLLERRPFAELVQQVDADPAWRQVYADDLSVLYRRSAPR